MKARIIIAVSVTAVLMSAAVVSVWAYSRAAAAQAIQRPAPVMQYATASPSAQATVSGTCEPGILDGAVNQFYPVNSKQLVPSADYFQYAEAGYQVTLDNTTSSPVSVSAVATVFYDSSGTQTGSDQEQITGIVMPGQSQTWTLTPWDAPGGQLAQYPSYNAAPFAAGQGVDTGATCQIVQWSHS